jgi:hypothetical protein
MMIVKADDEALEHRLADVVGEKPQPQQSRGQRDEARRMAAAASRTQPVVDRREDRTELRRREERLEEGGMALAEPSHAVAVHNSELAQARGEPTDALGEFGMALPRRTVHQRDVVRCDAGSPFDP